MTFRSIITYNVRPIGNSLFPTDMLRRDGSWPKDTDSAIRMAAAIRDCEDFIECWTDGNEDDPPSISLCTYGEPNAERWRSFGWKIVSFERTSI